MKTKKQRKPRAKATDETKRKMSETRKGKPKSEEHRAALSRSQIRNSQLFMGVRTALKEVPVRELPEGLKERVEAFRRANPK